MYFGNVLNTVCGIMHNICHSNIWFIQMYEPCYSMLFIVTLLNCSSI